ncbi:MAG: MASE1 domain-containing protein, partial [Lysobacteraceae bacterium]
MPTPPRSFWLVPLFVALYSAGGLLGGLLVVGPDGVVLLWPPGALSFVLLMREGRRKWWLVALADLTYSLVGSPAPLSFLPFSMAANVAGALAASTVARRLGMRSGDLFHLGSVRVLLIAGATLALASLPFGLMGLVLTGVTPPSAVGDAAITWLVANVFGVLVLGPGISLLWRSQDDPLALPTTALVGFERSAWCVALGLSLTVVALTPHETVRNAAAVLAVPTIVLLWAAVRMPPRWAAAGCLVTGLALTLTAAFNLGALEEPKNTQEALILLMLLFTLMLAPLVLMAALED